MQAKSHLAVVAPNGKKRAVVPSQRPNAAYRKRGHLTQTEIENLIEAAKGNRYGHRDATMILVAYRHGLRASEICELSWDAIDFNAATIPVLTDRQQRHAKSLRAYLINDLLETQQWTTTQVYARDTYWASKIGLLRRTPMLAFS